MLVQIVSDVTCPWCRIGKHNLSQAANTFTAETGEAVHLQFLPFLLDPIEPGEENLSYRDRFTQGKGLTTEQMEEMFAHATEAGAHYGLTFHFDRIGKAVNTIPAHAMMTLLPERDQPRMMDALMTAYFERGEDVGDPDVILRLAREAGIDPALINGAEQPLRKGHAEDDVRNAIRNIQMSGISGVPFIILDGKLAVAGGQPPEVFLDALRQAHGMSHPTSDEASESPADVSAEDSVDEITE